MKGLCSDIPISTQLQPGDSKNAKLDKSYVTMCKAVQAFLSYVRMILDKIIDFVFSFYWEHKTEPIPHLDKRHEILAESATSLARKIREKQLKSEDLVRAVIERIGKVNPLINAIAEDRFQAALAEAKDVDRLIAAGISEEVWQQKPFLGVPFTSKESHEVKGMKLTLGLWVRREQRGSADSETIVRLKNAGAIHVATTNTPEMLIWQETRNPVYGTTNNPHHLGRSPGGSSGAEAALTASYASTISLCSDLGGSIRMPAFYCGVFGHHPTANITNNEGVCFRSGEHDSMLSLGFISKNAEDLEPLMKVIAGDKANLLGFDRNINIKDVKFYYLESGADCHVSRIKPELREAMQRVVTKLSQEALSTDFAPQSYNHEGFNHMYKLWQYWMTKEPDNYAKCLNNRSTEAYWLTELLKKLFCMSHHCFFTIMMLIEIQLLPSVNSQWAEKLSKEFKEDLFNKLGSNGVLLMPSGPDVCPYHYSCVLRPYNFAYWAVVNMLKCPATQVPLGKNSQGLPMGIQVLAAPHNDGLCLTVAQYLEKQFGGAIMACDKC